MHEDILKVNGLTYGYGEEALLRNLDFCCHRGEFCAIFGPNGVGKTTLLKLIMGYLKLWQGEVLIREKGITAWDRRSLARVLAIMPQELDLHFDYNVTELIMMGRYPYLSYLHFYSREDRSIVNDMLKQLDLYHYRFTSYAKLSGGEKQRVSIARALVQESDIILVDEAFSGLDINHQVELMEIFRNIYRKRNKLILLVSHNLNLVSDYCSRVLLLKNGNILADGPPEQVINARNLEIMYDKKLQVITNPLSGKPNLIYPGYEN
ncbi:MAG: ABC transporter ATP-binding protein [Candidatus Cloacimonetes bacterium]|nr:ABC transporter ATP-binding protein [Candidatus Cloacimonadota bacterium]